MIPASAISDSLGENVVVDTARLLVRKELSISATFSICVSPVLFLAAVACWRHFLGAAPLGMQGKPDIVDVLPSLKERDSG